MDFSVLNLTGVKSFDYFFSLFFYFNVGILPLFLVLILFTRKW